MDLHIDLHHTDWLHDLVYPLLFFAVPMAMMFWAGEWLLLTVPMMFLAGFVFAPRHLWLVWLGTVAILWGVQGVAALMGEFESEPGSGETLWGFAPVALVFTVVLVLVPLWLGRKLHQVRTRSTTV